jgi:hypothetical protein
MVLFTNGASRAPIGISVRYVVCPYRPGPLHHKEYRINILALQAQQSHPALDLHHMLAKSVSRAFQDAIIRSGSASSILKSHTANNYAINSFTTDRTVPEQSPGL